MIEQALRHLWSGVHELRALNVPEGAYHVRAIAGFFDDPEAMAREAAQLSERGATGVYWTPNPVNPDLLARSVNRTRRAERGASTADGDITLRRWLLVDVDAKRPSGISSSEEEHDAAIERARLISVQLQESGWPCPITVDSGNGCHLMWRVDWPNDDDHRDLAKRILAELERQYGTEHVEIDGAVFNAARLWRVPGTFARKGDSTEERPHRRSRVLAMPRLELVPRAAVMALLPEPMGASTVPDPTTSSATSTFDIEGFISRHLPDADGPHSYQGGRKWVLPVCPFDSAHDDRSACVTERSGVLGFKCHHNGCTGRGWRDLRAHYEPDYEPQEAEPEQSWRSQLLRGKPKAEGELGPLLPVEANVQTILLHDERWQGVLGFDQFARKTVCLKQPPWHATEQGEHEGSAWGDLDSTRLRSWLSRTWGLHVRFALEPSVEIIARKNCFHAVRQFLDGLAWDGTERLPTWLELYLGAESSSYMARVGVWWLISAVARIYRPGCQVDHVLVLEGPQGARKSSALQALGGDWFSDSPIDLDSKDAFISLRGQWILELSELDSLSRAESARVKSFLTSRVDVYRPPYGKALVEQPRQCVFAGSTNEAGYLKDTTGNRRFWPLRCGTIDLEALTRDREQLWAEAVHRFRAGERWWPEGEAEVSMCAEEQNARLAVDPWTDDVLKWIDGRIGRFTTTDILTEGLGFESRQVNRWHQTRVGKILATCSLPIVTSRPRIAGVRVTAYEIDRGQVDNLDQLTVVPLVQPGNARHTRG